MHLLRSALAIALLSLLCLGSLPQLNAAEPRTPETAVTPNNRNPERHAKFLERIKEGPVDLLFLGDSITDYWTDTSPETWAKLAPYKPANFGITAERTEDLLWRITNGELEGIDPKAVVLLIGTNNVGQCKDEKPEWAAAGVKKIIDVVHEKLPKAKILLLAVFPRSAKKDSPIQQKVNAINDIIKNYADGSTVTYLDINDKFLNEEGNVNKDLMPDLLHPNPKGYQVWLDAMMPTLEQLLK